MFSFPAILFLNRSLMTSSYRPQFLWLLTGPLIGACAGALTGVGILATVALADPQPPSLGGVVRGALGLLAAGVLIGGFVGAVTGFFAGLPFIFLVGRHLTRRVARGRAFVLGAVMSPLAMLTAFAVLLHDPGVLSLGPLTSAGWDDVVPLLVPSVLGGSLATWAAGKDELPRPVS